MTMALNASEEIRAAAIHALEIIESMPGHAWSADAAGKFTYVSPNTTAYLGEAREHLNEVEVEDEFGWRHFVHPDDYERVAARWRHCLATGERYDTEHRLRRADGVYRWFRNSGSPSRDRDGRITQWYGTTLDIEDQKRAETALRERERELAQLVDMVPSHIWKLTPGGEPAFFNKRMSDYLGLGVAGMDGAGVSRLDALIAAVHPEDAAEFRRRLGHCLANGERFAMRYRLRRADGAYRWMSSSAEPIRDDGGSILQWYGLCHDVDEQIRAEEALRRSEQQLRQLVDAVPALIWSTTREGTPSYINKRFIDTVGVTLDDLTAPDASCSLSDIHPDDRPVVQQALDQSFATGSDFALAYRQQRSDGSYRWTEGRAEPLRDEAGQIVQWYGVCVDIHDLVTTQAALRDRERELSQLVDLVPVHIRRLTPEGKPIFFNKRLIDFFDLGDVSELDRPGMSRLAAGIGSLVHPDEATKLLATLCHSLATGEPYVMKYRMRRADGLYRWVDGRGEPVRDESGAIVQWYAISLDIDDEVRAQEAARKRERELSQLVDMVPSFIWRLSAHGEPIFFNKRLIDYLGFDTDGVEAPQLSRLAALIEAAIHPDDAAGVAERLSHCLMSGDNFAMRYRLRRADGVYRWVSGRAEPLKDENGWILQWYGLSHDIDDQLRVEDELRERERRLWQLVETLPAMIDCAAPDGEPIYRSQQLRAFLGYDLEELDGTGKSRLAGTLDAGVHPDDVAGVKEGYAHSLMTGEPYARRHRLRRFDGEYRWVETRAAPMRKPDGEIVQWNVICLDIDGEVRAQEDLRLAQESLARASQAASLAELSASIAHEVNQPLAAIVANSHACHRWLSADPPNIDRAKLTAERIVRDANSAADVVSRIRALFKQSVEQKCWTALSAVIGEVHSLMADEALRRRVRIYADVEGGLPAIALDRVHIQQVLVNLIRNGMDAMDRAAGLKLLGINVRRRGDMVQTEISDSGAGGELPDRMFEPFFTTKEQGMGMGLAICRSIVEAHGGRIWAEKNEPQGAKFIFTLPIVGNAAAC